MRPIKALIVIMLVAVCNNLISIKAVEYLKEPKLTQVLDSLKFLPFEGHFNLRIKKIQSNRIITIYACRNWQKRPNYAYFYKNNEKVKEIKIDDDSQSEFCIRQNPDMCLLPRDNLWLLYNGSGDLIRSYNNIGKGYFPYRISTSGIVVFIHEKEYYAPFDSVAIVNPESKIVYQKNIEKLSSELDFSNNGKYIAILEKNRTKNKRGHRKPDALLTIYDGEFKVVYKHKFKGYNDSSDCFMPQSMTFINNTLLLALKTKPYIRLDPLPKDYNYTHEYKFVAIDADNPHLYVQKKKMRFEAWQMDLFVSFINKLR